MDEHWSAFLVSLLGLIVIVYVVGWLISRVPTWKKPKARKISRWLCKCGHEQISHNGSSGPNSNGRYHHRECTEGSKSFPPYRVGGCNCYEYKKDILLTLKGMVGRVSVSHE